MVGEADLSSTSWMTASHPTSMSLTPTQMHLYHLHQLNLVL